MKVNNIISHFRQFTVIFLAMLAFTTVICHYSVDQVLENIFFNAGTVENEATLPADQQEERSAEHLSTLAYEAIVPIAQLSLVQELYIIADLTLLNEIEMEEVLETPLYFNSYFKTLFRLIISPNAP